MFNKEIGHVVVKEFYNKKVPSNEGMKYNNGANQRIPFKVFTDSVVFHPVLKMCELPNNVYIVKGVTRRDKKIEKYLLPGNPCPVNITIPLLDILDNNVHKLFDFYIKEEYKQDILDYLIALISERRKRPHDSDILEIRNSAFVVEYLSELCVRVAHNGILFIKQTCDEDDEIKLDDFEM